MECRVEVEGYPLVRCAAGASLLEVCEGAAIPMASACGGLAACNSCRVEVLGGAESLSELLPEEEPFLDEAHQRLGCQARVQGDVQVRLAPGA
jgi:2Fe-2S ferredoxin